MIPYAIIGQIILRLIDFFARRAERKEKLKQKMFEFIERHDRSVLDNVKLRDEYDELMKRAKKKKD